MKLFSKKKPEEKRSQWQDKAAVKIVKRLQWVQRRWAAFMQRHFERLSIKGKKCMLVAFILLFCGYSVYLIAEGLFVKPNKRSFAVSQLKLSPVRDSDIPIPFKRPAAITEQEFGKIHLYRLSLDSAIASKGVNPQADSVLTKRPGLRDSLMQLEELYLSQIKK